MLFMLWYPYKNTFQWLKVEIIRYFIFWISLLIKKKLRDPSFGENHRKLRTARSTSATGNWTWHLPSTSFWAQLLVEPRTDSSTSMPYPGFEPGISGTAAGFPNHCTIWSARHSRGFSLLCHHVLLWPTIIISPCHRPAFSEFGAARSCHTKCLNADANPPFRKFHLKLFPNVRLLKRNVLKQFWSSFFSQKRMKFGGVTIQVKMHRMMLPIFLLV